MKIFLALTLAASTVPVAAQNSFLGIDLDSPFPGSMLECPKVKGIDMVDREALKTFGVCYFAESPNKYSVLNGPALGLGSVTVETQNGKPLWFRMQFSKAQYGLAAEIFTTKFGKAQKADREKIYTRAGEVFDSRTHFWNGSRLRIQLNEVGRDVRWSDGSILNVTLWDDLERQMKLDAKRAAEKL